MKDLPAKWNHGDKIESPLNLYRTQVIPEWIDYNGHMTTVAYHQAFDDALEAFFLYIGCDEHYRQSGFAIFVVESHTRHLNECQLGTPLQVSSQVLALDEKRCHLLLCMLHAATGELVSTEEIILLHVDNRIPKVVSFRPGLRAALEAICLAHENSNDSNERNPSVLLKLHGR